MGGLEAHLTTFAVPWPYHGAEELHVEVGGAPDPAVERMVRSAATLTTTHAGLRFMLEATIGKGYRVRIREMVSGKTLVEIFKR